MKLKNAIGIWRERPEYKVQKQIHWFIWLMENPNSPIALTGAIDLYNHDIIHILLDRGMDIRDEAMVIGFTMGNSNKTRSWVRWIFEFIAQHLYPAGYKFGERSRFLKPDEKGKDSSSEQKFPEAYDQKVVNSRRTNRAIV
jgi:hypothetical protein